MYIPSIRTNGLVWNQWQQDNYVEKHIGIDISRIKGAVSEDILYTSMNIGRE